MSELPCQSWSHAPLPFFCAFRICCLGILNRLCYIFFSWREDNNSERRFHPSQPDGPVSFSGSLTGTRVIDSCNWEHPGWGLMKASLHVWRDSSNKYGRLIEPLEGVFRVLYLLMKQDIDSKLSSSDWPRNEIKGDQGPWSGRKVTDSCCLFSRPLHHSYNGRTNVTNCWSNLRQWRPCVSWGALLPPGGYGFINRN